MPAPLNAADYACLFAGHPRTAALRALQSWGEAIDGLVASGRTRAHEAAHHKLQWWQEELQRLSAGSPVHPLTREMRQFAPEPGLWTALQERLELAALELGGVAPDDADAAARWDWRRHGVLQWTCIKLLAPAATLPEAPTHAALHRLAQHLGQALGRLDACTLPLASARQGRLGLPLEALEAHGIAIGELPEALGAPAHTAALATVVSGQLEIAERALALAAHEWVSQTADVRAELRAVAVRQALAGLALRRLRQNPLCQDATTLLPAWRSLWNAWQAARTAHR
ncbi:MAG: hypothetical protein RJB26_1629 [Pseudomonadota bacterium]